MDEHSTPSARATPLRARLALGAFDLLYRSAILYWLASTIPFAGQWRTWQRLVLPRLHGRDILEIGCGPGWLLADMVAAGYHCQAIDASPQMVAAARRTLARRKVSGGSVTLARVQALPFPDAQFDAVVSSFPTPYIAEATSIREIARVLRPGGRLIIVEGAQLLPRGPLLGALTRFQRFVYGQTTTSTPDDAAQLAALRRRIPLEAAGLVPTHEIVTGPCWRAFIAYGAKPAP
jgi:ubiquinone/menaquinone biosynthesis C-methylase UbiE